MQKVTKYTDKDLTRIIARDFPNEMKQTVSQLLMAYGKETWHQEPLRVQMACLKAANGDLSALRQAVKTAYLDYRDILAWQEYPAYMTAKNAEQQKLAIKSDRVQLQTWLHRE